jgi:uncharacterized membrane protein YhaH (DUF805 family)
MQYFIRAYRQFADFNGRATRAEYWWFVLIFLILYVVLVVLESTLGLVSESLEVGYLSTAFSLVSLLPSLAVATRRLHDVNNSGWRQLLYLVPLFGALFLIYLLAQPGSAEDNAYGPPTTVPA